MKLYCPLHDLIINPPHKKKKKKKKLSLIYHEKLVKKGPSILFGGRHYALAPVENHVGVCAPSIFVRKCGLKLVNILTLAALR